MKRNIPFLTCVLLLGGIRCFALDATDFFQKHACVPAGEHASRCSIRYGDTLSKDALAVYGDGHRYPAIKDANPEIADANKIYADKWIIIPDVPTRPSIAVAMTPRVQPRAIVAPKATLELTSEPATVLLSTIPVEEVSATIPTSDLPLSSPETVPPTEASADPSPRSPQPPPAQPMITASTPTSAKISGYQFVVSGSELQGPLQTQLVLFNSEEEKRLGLPCGNCRIDLKPSLAVPAKDGDTAVFVHLKKLPAQPFVLLVGGIKNPVDSSEIQAYSGKTPGTHAFARVMIEIGKLGAQGGISLAVTGNPFIAGAVVGAPRLVNFIVAQRQKAAERKLAAAQAAVDKSKLALYRASLESRTLSKEIRQ